MADDGTTSPEGLLRTEPERIERIEPGIELGRFGRRKRLERDLLPLAVLALDPGRELLNLEVRVFDEAEQLVPAIMHLTIEESWWPPFDEFYAAYLELCR